MPWIDTNKPSPLVASPAKYIEYMRSLGKLPNTLPPVGVIFCYQKTLLNYIIEHHVSYSGYGFLYDLHWLKAPYEHLAVQKVVTAPGAVIKLEEYIALGVKRFLSIGTAGSLQANIPNGSIVLCDRAVRDDGVSQHYLPEEKYAYPSLRLKDELAACLKEQNLPFYEGTSWTTSAIYRETQHAVLQCQREGVATVDMEAAALFSVAQAHEVELASLFTVSDNLSTLTWHPESHSKGVVGGLEKIFHVAVNALK